jgi:tryptophan 2,3-dioxygenase
MPTYADYLNLDPLLTLQAAGGEHDELLFIVVHQTYELWFKQILHEFDHLRTLLAADDLPRAGHTLKRVLTILKVLVAQVDILETMTPLEFLGFRERLGAGSGFQSAQFREIEFVLGHKRAEMMKPFPPGSDAHTRLAQRFRVSGVWDWFVHFLAGRKYAVPGELLTRDVTQPPAASPELQKTLIHVYRTDPAVAALCKRLVDLDEGVQEWRYRHVKMVERTIGGQLGTGGSSGAAYLRSTLLRPMFPALWQVRDRF